MLLECVHTSCVSRLLGCAGFFSRTNNTYAATAPRLLGSRCCNKWPRIARELRVRSGNLPGPTPSPLAGVELLLVRRTLCRDPILLLDTCRIRLLKPDPRRSGCCTFSSCSCLLVEFLLEYSNPDVSPSRSATISRFKILCVESIDGRRLGSGSHARFIRIRSGVDHAASSTGRSFPLTTYTAWSVRDMPS